MSAPMDNFTTPSSTASPAHSSALSDEQQLFSDIMASFSCEQELETLIDEERYGGGTVAAFCVIA